NESPYRLLVDGSIIVTGGYQGTIDFDNDDVPESTSSSGSDVFVVEYLPDGSLGGFLVASGNGADWGTGVVVDGDLNMYVVGTFQNELDIFDDGSDDLDTYGSHDVFLFCAPRIVPVELVSFNATVDGDNVLLMWETASETNNAGFEVQVRSEGGVFEAVSFVEGHGTTTEAQVYSHTVIDLDPGTYAFRLKQIDFDGAFEYSPAIEATVGVPGSHVLSAVYPNPFNPQTNFTLAVRETQTVAITVHDVLGREVVTLFDGNVEGGSTHTFTWQASGLPSGMYMIRVIGESFAETRSVTLLQ
ncbi:MAG: T9SS type A sorting domain-containing protein, partial [Bacteroidetes bacterium]|nr:T9SS type A sorting domain-containing protein [Bacteroidota bacterium]